MCRSGAYTLPMHPASGCKQLVGLINSWFWLVPGAQLTEVEQRLSGGTDFWFRSFTKLQEGVFTPLLREQARRARRARRARLQKHLNPCPSSQGTKLDVQMASVGHAGVRLFRP